MPSDPILIVDDNPANLKLARILLVSEGYIVRTANDAEQAIALLETWRPRLILMDIQLPGMDGLELTQKLKADPRTKDILIVALTAYAMKGDEEKARSAGCDGYIPKPIDPDLLASSVGDYLGHPPTPAPAPRPVRSVLVVENNAATLKTYADALVAAGYEVIEASSGASALGHLRDRVPHIILLDLCLTDMDGLELTRLIRELPGGIDVPIVALSGLQGMTEEAVALPVGFDEFLVKPIDAARLVATIRTYLPAPAPGTEDLGAGRRILVVDDDPVQLKLARIHLTQSGFEVETAQDGPTALDLARASPPDLILTDALMPGMDGFDFCVAVRREAPLRSIPVIIISSHYRVEADYDLARDVGADALLLRSPDFQAVTTAVVERLNAKTPPPVPSVTRVSKKERERRVIRQLERQVTVNASLAQRCTLQAAQLSALGTVADELARSGDIDAALQSVLVACLDAGGISKGALYKTDARGELSLAHTIGFSADDRPALEAIFGQREVLDQVVARELAVAFPSPTFPPRQAETFTAGVGVSSVLVVPLLGAKRRLGALVLGSSVKNLADQDQVIFGRAIGAYVGQAMALASAFSTVAQSEKRKSDFLNMLGHELRNPLSAIVTALHFFDGSRESPAFERARDVTKRQVRQLTRLVDDLLDVSRIMHAKIQLVREPVDLRALVRDLAEDQKGLVDASKLTLSLELPQNPVVIDADRTRVCQMIGNLVGNAIKFTNPGGRVTVRLEAADGWARICVSDTGVGLQPELLPEIFQPFIQGDQSLARTRGGLGLGLSVVKGICDLHGGTVSASSKGPNLGSEFTVALPIGILTARTPRPSSLFAAQEAEAGLRVLVIEDNFDLAAMLAQLLKQWGHEVETARTGSEGIETALRWGPQVIICDIGLPVLDGFAVATALRADPRTRGVKLIAMSGYGQQEDRARTKAVGFERHLTKPVDPDEFARLMAGLAAASD